jgi:hypothetical protein
MVSVESSVGLIPALIDSVGEGRVLFETDFPYPTCLYPKPLDTVAEKMSTLRPGVQRQDPV